MKSSRTRPCPVRYVLISLPNVHFIQSRRFKNPNQRSSEAAYDWAARKRRAVASSVSSTRCFSWTCSSRCCSIRTWSHRTRSCGGQECPGSDKLCRRSGTWTRSGTSVCCVGSTRSRIADRVRSAGYLLQAIGRKRGISLLLVYFRSGFFRQFDSIVSPKPSM